MSTPLGTTQNIVFLIYPGCQILDVSGPLAAFEEANKLQPGRYALRVVAAEAGPVVTSCGVALLAEDLAAADRVDTLLIVGGDGVMAAAQSAALLAFVRRWAAPARRVSSVCSGAFVLAEAGLLDGRRATTHWRRSAEFQRRFARVNLEADRIYIKDGKFWTAAGISAGIDLALALITDDVGEACARQVARLLVVYYRRPGGQSQFSALQEMAPAPARFAGLLDYIRENLAASLGVDDLAAQACMSPRHFARRFSSEVGVTPAKAVERLRVEAASAALESGARSIQEVARLCGFVEPERMRRAFLRILGKLPMAIKRQQSAQTEATLPASPLPVPNHQ